MFTSENDGQPSSHECYEETSLLSLHHGVKCVSSPMLDVSSSIPVLLPSGKRRAGQHVRLDINVIPPPMNTELKYICRMKYFIFVRPRRTYAASGTGGTQR